MRRSTSGFVGSHLREARKIRGQTAMALAEQLGLTKQAISNYETGRQSPSPEVSDRISEILNLPIDFFLVKNSTRSRDISPRFYRSMAAATKTAREKAESKSNVLIQLTEIVESLVEIPLPNLPDFKPSSDPNKITTEYIENAAIEARTFWGLGNGPISNIVWLLENNGVLTIRRSLEASTLDAFSLWVDERPYIVLSSDKGSAVRSRFDIAHELGHLLLHRNIPNLCIQTSDYFKLIESQANRFAGAFLFPEKSFVMEIVNCNLEAFRLMKRRWKVSIAMMLKRSQDLELVGEKKAELLWRYYMKNGWKTNEPFDDVIEIEQPYLLKESIQLILDEGILSSTELVEELRMYHKDIEDIAGLPQGFLAPKTDNLLHLKLRKSSSETTIYAENAEILNFPNQHIVKN